MDTTSRRLIERRVARRWRSIEEHGVVLGRVRPGHGAAVLNIGSSGVLVETMCRLLPQAIVELHLETIHRRWLVRGRVVRAFVSDLCADRVTYRGAIKFDHTLGWLMHSLCDEHSLLITGRVDLAGCEQTLPTFGSA